MKTGISMILLDLIIFQKLLKIFMLVTLINRNLKQEQKSEEKINLLERSCI